MKRIIVLSITSLFVLGCSSNSNKSGKTDTVVAGETLAKAKNTPRTNNTPTVSSLCFLRIDGKSKPDSTSIELVIKGDQVTGQMNWLPYQKDSRKGTLSGIMKGDTIQAKWSFMQEGMKDTLNLRFKLNGDKLLQKPLKLNTKTGRDQTDDKASYTLTYHSSVQVHQ